MNRTARGIGLGLAGSGVGIVVTIVLGDIFIPVHCGTVIKIATYGMACLVAGFVILLITRLRNE